MNILVVPNLSLHLECFVSMIAMMGKSCNFCILLGGFGDSGRLVGGMISGSSVKTCWCMLHGGWHISVQFVVQNRCNAILSAFLMVGVILLWYFYNSFSFMMVVLFGNVICSNVVMFSSSSWCRYFWFIFGVIMG
jgi:hypothetical protein